MTKPPLTADKNARTSSDAARLIVNTGNGRGKSSSAFGIMGRAWARGWNIAVVQFIKGPDWKTGEQKLGEHLGVTWHTLGDGFTWDSNDIEASRAQNVRAWSTAHDALTNGAFDLVILDELTYLLDWGWLDVDVVVHALMERSDRTHVVITGRAAPDALLAIADTVTVMESPKHAFDAGILAKKGIEY